jgi:hypothetical protein
VTNDEYNEESKDFLRLNLKKTETKKWRAEIQHAISISNKYNQMIIIHAMHEELR